eukprot:gene2480-18142_t
MSESPQRYSALKSKGIQKNGTEDDEKSIRIDTASSTGMKGTAESCGSEENVQMSIPTVSFRPKESLSLAEEKEGNGSASESFLSGLQKKAKYFGLRSSASDLTNSEHDKEHEKKVTKESADKWKDAADISVENKYTTTRRKIISDSSKYRRGPVPVESLPSSAHGLQAPTHGTIDSDDEYENNCRPSSKGLLVYFARLGEIWDENEKVDINFIGSLFKAGANVNHEDRYGQTALHAAARDWNIDVAKYLLDNGALLDKGDKHGRTPLHLAAAVDHHEMIRFLVLNGANIDEKSVEGQTPLHFACKNDAVNSIKTLLSLGAQINLRDNKLRTPLFVAAESGRAHAATALLDADAPAGVYDIYGTSALACMVEKMPAVAYNAISQFYIDDKALRRKYFYLDQLESDVNAKDKSKSFAKNALEMIVVYRETDLVMHQVIQKMINVKWNLFARKKSIIELVINFIYTLIWVILALLIPRDGKFHTPLASKSWRIVLEAIFFFLTVYFAFKEIFMFKLMRKIDSRWRKWAIHNLEDELESCHPKWPEERKYVESEIQRVWGFRGSYSRNIGWSVYEWCCHVSVLAVAAAEVYYELHPTVAVAGKVYKIILSVSIMMVCIRLMKICRAFTFLSAFIVLLGHVVGATLRFAFLFFEFFIPYVCILWIVFGGDENAKNIDKISKGDGERFRTFDEIIYITWLMTVTADIPFSPMVQYHRILASIIVGTYYALVSVVCINLYIALMSETFTRVYENAEANASLQQALLIIFMERQMGPAESAKMRKHFAKKCSPLEQLEYGQENSRASSYDVEASLVLGNVDRRLQTLARTVDQSEQEAGRFPNQDADATLMKELKTKCRGVRQRHHSFAKSVAGSLEDVMKVQLDITKTLQSIGK